MLNELDKILMDKHVSPETQAVPLSMYLDAHTHFPVELSQLECGNMQSIFSSHLSPGTGASGRHTLPFEEACEPASHWQVPSLHDMLSNPQSKSFWQDSPAPKVDFDKMMLLMVDIPT